MSTRFENWFVHFVAEHNTPAASLECGELTTHRYESFPAGCSSETGLATVSNEHTRFLRSERFVVQVSRNARTK